MKKDVSKIKYIVLDVDGTLTDSGVIYDDNGYESKRFSTKDGVGFNLAHLMGIKIIVMTGRESSVTLRRMTELKTDFIMQNIHNKEEMLKEFMSENNISKEEIAYVGDDLNDHNSMLLCGYIGCPLDAAVQIKEIADYVSDKKGGYGAVRDVIENILMLRGDGEEIYSRYYELSL